MWHKGPSNLTKTLIRNCKNTTKIIQVLWCSEISATPCSVTQCHMPDAFNHHIKRVVWKWGNAAYIRNDSCKQDMNTHLRGGCYSCQVLAYCLHDPPTPHPQSNRDADTPIQQKVYWGLCFLFHISFSVGQPYCYHWTNSIAGRSYSHLIHTTTFLCELYSSTVILSA